MRPHPARYQNEAIGRSEGRTTAFPGAQVHSTGATPAMMDIRDVTGSDLKRIATVVLGGIFLVTVLLLRALVAPLYLRATVLLSLGATSCPGSASRRPDSAAH